MDTTFINSGNSETTDLHRLLLNITNKIDLVNKLETVNRLLYQITAFTIGEKIYKSHTKTINLKYQLQHHVKNFNYLMHHNLHPILKIFLSISSKDMKE